MSWGPFAVQLRRPGTGWRLDDFRFRHADTADCYASGPVFADADTRVVELRDGMVTIVSERLAIEKRAAS